MIWKTVLYLEAGQEGEVGDHAPGQREAGEGEAAAGDQGREGRPVNHEQSLARGGEDLDEGGGAANPNTNPQQTFV